MKKWVRIVSLCPECEVGTIFAVRNKKDNTLCAYCEECDTLWKIPADIEKRKYFENLENVFEWGGYATLEEVKAFGWEEYIREP